MSALAPNHIAVTNVRPAYAASLAAGVSPLALENLGLAATTLADPDGAVHGQATYAHFEAMAARPDYADFVADAVHRHTFSTLGIVGLACKTLDTIQGALACHHRFQHLTNQTARYHNHIQDSVLIFREERWGAPRPGLLYVSEYTALVALQLLRLATQSEVPALALHTRSASISAPLLAMMSSYLKAPVHLGAQHTALHVDARVLAMPVQSADAELAAYFQGKLTRAAQVVDGEPEVLRRVRGAIQYTLATGKPTSARVAKQLAMSPRTLQRRLKAHDRSFAGILEHTRRGLAERYLADPSLNLAEVAYLCGYSEQSSFFRAFRQWTGQTPTARRAALLSGSKAPN